MNNNKEKGHPIETRAYWTRWELNKLIDNVTVSINKASSFLTALMVPGAGWIFSEISKNLLLNHIDDPDNRDEVIESNRYNSSVSTASTLLFSLAGIYITKIDPNLGKELLQNPDFNQIFEYFLISGGIAAATTVSIPIASKILKKIIDILPDKMIAKLDGVHEKFPEKINELLKKSGNFLHNIKNHILENFSSDNKLNTKQETSTSLKFT